MCCLFSLHSACTLFNRNWFMSTSSPVAVPSSLLWPCIALSNPSWSGDSWWDVFHVHAEEYRTRNVWVSYSWSYFYTNLPTSYPAMSNQPSWTQLWRLWKKINWTSSLLFSNFASGLGSMWQSYNFMATKLRTNSFGGGQSQATTMLVGLEKMLQSALQVKSHGIKSTKRMKLPIFRTIGQKPAGGIAWWIPANTCENDNRKYTTFWRFCIREIFKN